MSTKKPKSNDKNKKARRKIWSKPTRNKVLGGGIVIVSVAGLFTGVLMYQLFKEKPSLNYGIFWNPEMADPLLYTESYEPVSKLIITQITETLFRAELFGESSRIVPHLAESYSWSEDGLNFTCTLREDITFHDGTLLTAQSVKWNIDRLHRLYDAFGFGYNLWQFPGGGWIVNKTEVVDELTVRFLLNSPFSPLPALLSQQHVSIIKPNSTIENDFVYQFSLPLCGTGPYKFESYTKNESVVLLPNKNYWNGPKANFGKILFKIYHNDEEKSSSEKIFEAWQNGEIHMQITQDPTSFWDLDYLRNRSDLVVREFKYSTIPSQIYLNCRLINSTMRKAIIYAFNYTDYLKLINETLDYPAVRMHTPVHHNLRYSELDDYDLPWCNISLARQTLLESGWPGTSGLVADNNVSVGNPWETIAESGTPLATYNYSHNGWYQWWHPYGSMARDLKQIGVKLVEDGRGWMDWWNALQNRELEISYGGWFADFNDPHSGYTQQFWNTSLSNTFDVNDPQLQIWMEQGFTERNDTIRGDIYVNITKRIMEEIYPFLLLYWDLKYDVHVSNLINVPNPFEFGGKSLKDMSFE